jgi:Ca2+-binding EF-hand superfamily protein
VIDEQEIAKLWQAFKVLDVDGNGAISTNELGEVMRSLGQNPTETGLRDLIKEIDVDLSGTIDFEEFKTLMIAKVGDRKSRLKLAFSAFDEDSSGQITTVELRTVMSQFGLTEAELKEMLQEVDHDGDGSIDFDEFCQLVPESEDKTGYKDSPIYFESSVADTTQPTLQEATSNTTPELAQLREQLVQHPNSPNQKKSGTSRLQMQIGLFRLIQGAAYRCFRESFSANHETHLRVKNLPYRITDFVEFVKQAIALYKGLGVVEEACYPVLDAVVKSIADEYARLQERIKDWKIVTKTPEMLAEEKAILEARSKFANVKEKFAAGVEFAITIKKKSLSLGDIVEGVLAINELNRLRGIEMNEEMAPPPPKSQGNPRDYLLKWNRVILSQATEEVDGAMMPVAYWYEDFLPKLLAAFSVSTAADIQSNTIPNEAGLDEWYDCTKKSGEFNRYGADVAENFLHCTAKEKLILKQAWLLTHHYLNGVQKRRERLEFGRESGALSQYVSFIDVYLNRTEVKDSQMRVSFPYYIGPAVWRFFHTTAEIVCTKTDVQQKTLIAIFKDFFQLFATMYPCPYCRHHLNMYVVQNKEIDMYPVEYLVLGRDPDLTDFEVSLEAKLSTVVDGSSLRLFFWKLHNTVSSSIARSEEWYHKDEKAFYTTRFWPSLDSELARANALKYTSIETARIYNIYGMLKPLARLTGVKTELPKLLQKGDENSLKEACIIAQNHIADLEEAVIWGDFLQETYYFDPDVVDKAPLFTPEEEEFARTGMFTETV